MSKVIELEPKAPRLWIVFDVDGKVLQLFKGTHNDALEFTAKVYPGRVGKAQEAVDCTLLDVEFATALLHAEWLMVQFGLLAQATAQVQVARPGGPLIKH